MLHYRLYQLRGPKNHIESVHEFFADTDAMAIELAEVWRTDNPMELWSADRKIQRWDARKLVLDSTIEGATERS